MKKLTIALFASAMLAFCQLGSIGNVPFPEFRQTLNTILSQGVSLTGTQTVTNKTVDGVTPTVFGYLANVTSDLQAQIDSKATIGALPAFPAGTIVGTSDSQILTNKTVDGVTPTTMGYLDATSSIQGQLNAKQGALSGTWNRIAGTPDQASGVVSPRRLTLNDMPPIVAASTAASLVSSWTGRTTPQSSNWGNLAYSPELHRLVTVSFVSGAYGHVMTSDDGGVTWMVRTTPGDAYQWNGLVWVDELHLFVTTAHSGYEGSMSSADGITWTLNPSGALPGGAWDSIAWSPELHRACAATTASPFNTAYSADLVNWSAGNPVNPSAGSPQVIWVSELHLFVAAVNQASFGGGISTSSDCVNWTAQTVPAPASRWRRLAWSPQLGVMVAIDGASSGTVQRVMSSTDAVNWTLHSSVNDAATWNCVAWSPQLGLFSAIANNSTDTMYSYDGSTWISSGSYPGSQVAFNREIWLAEFGWFVATDGGTHASPQVMTTAPINASPFTPRQFIVGTSTGTVAAGDDPRLSDARTPTAHAASHQNGGSDEIATATPAPNAIPKAGAGGTLGSGWLPTIPRSLGGLNSTTPGTGLLRDGTTPSASELSGDATTSGSNVVTVAKVNGNTPGGTCSGQFVRSIDSSARPSCNPISSTDLPASSKIRAIGYTFDGNGSALTAGTTKYLTVPFACTISAWNFAVDAGTATIKIWKKATGTAIPTVTDSISQSTGISIASGTALHSTTLSDFTTTAVAANDIIAFNLFAASGVSYLNFILECDQ